VLPRVLMLRWAGGSKELLFLLWPSQRQEQMRQRRQEQMRQRLQEQMRQRRQATRHNTHNT
jgi:hypothetical protein